MLQDKQWTAFLMKGLGCPSFLLQQIMQGAIRALAPVIRYLPSIIASWVAYMLKLLFISMLGFTAWVSRFPHEQFYITFSVAVLFVSSAYACIVFAREEENRATSREFIDWRKELRTLRQRVDDSTVDDKAKEINALQSTIDNIAATNQELEDKIRAQKDEAIITSNELRQKLDEMDGILTDMENAEHGKTFAESRLKVEIERSEQMQRDNHSLRTTAENLDKERRNLIQKYGHAAIQINKLSDENTRLRLVLRQKEEENYYSDVRQIAEHLQTSLSSAKGKLSRVGTFLKDDVAINKRRPSDDVAAKKRRPLADP